MGDALDAMVTWLAVSYGACCPKLGQWSTLT
jgi:hypothetical protein